MNEWQPIEKAPRESNVRMDICINDGLVQLRATNCFWSSHSSRWVNGDGENIEGDGFEATHFMLVTLPSPSKQS